MTIYFYRATGKYGCFSNFSRHSFELDGVHWLASEHYFQAHKFIGTPYAEEVRLASTCAHPLAEGGMSSRGMPLVVLLPSGGLGQIKLATSTA
jgi:hypothetical protein